MSTVTPTNTEKALGIVLQMSDDLKLDLSYLASLVQNVDSKYRHARVGNRWIDVPSVQLKLVQRWIADFISCESRSLPSYITAYEPECSIVKNAAMHAKGRHLVHLDIKGCFYCCRYEDVLKVFQGIPARDTKTGKARRLSEYELTYLSTLSTVKRRDEETRHLSVGSPCSPMLANRILMPIDLEIRSTLGEGYTYTRYSDDICISSFEWIDIDYIASVVSAALAKQGFELNEGKTRCMGPGDHKRITGITITPEGVLSVGRSRKRRVEKELYCFLVNGEGDAGHILGLINFCRLVDPSYVMRLLEKYSNYGIAASTSGGVMAVLRQSQNDDQ